MYKFPTILLLTLVFLLCGCTDPERDNDGSGRDYPTLETFDQIDRSMSYMKSDPTRAHRMLDSIAEAGLMTQQRCEYFHAMVVFDGEYKLDSALLICDRLLDAGQFGDDRFLEEELCMLASNITASIGRHLATLRYANRGIALCHGDERMRGDEATMMARAGMAEQELGRIDRAQEIYAHAYQLLKGTTTFADMVALISLQKKQICLYNEAKQYDKTISTCHEIEQLVEHFERDPSFVGKRPVTMQEPGPTTKEFADFYRSQIYAHLARTYRLRIEQGQATDVQAETDSVRNYIDKLLLMDEAVQSESLVNVLSEMQFVGLKSEFDRVRPQAEELYRGDSLVSNYVVYLTLLANDAAASHDLQGSVNYLRRALAVSDSINLQERMHMLTEQMAINMVQEQQLERQDAESQLERQKLVSLLLAIVLIIIVVASLVISWLMRKNKEEQQLIEQTQQELDETEGEVKDLALQLLEGTMTDKASDNMQALYERIEKVMETKKLYLNANLDIKMVAEASCSSRSVVSTCINSVSGMTFRQWLAEYRLSLFEEMLKKYPDAQIDELIGRCGYKDQSTFRRQFKEKHGMTPFKYRRSLFEQS